MRAVIVKLAAELRHRRLQSALVGLIVMLATGTAAIALNLIGESSNPYDRSFNQQQGAHLVVFFDAGKTSPESIAATGPRLGATATGGPWPALTVPFRHGSSRDSLTLVGRPAPGGPVEVLRLSVGRWVERPGEIVVTRSFAGQSHVAIGDQLTALSVSSKPTFRVVGEAIDINEGPAGGWSQSAWILPSELDGLQGTGDHIEYKMAYRFAGTPNADVLDQSITTLKSSLPPAAVTDAVSFLDVKDVFNRQTSAILIFLLAFSVFALGAVALIVANIVTGGVISSYREVGIMKAVGFTPAQVVQVFVGLMIVPTLAGSLVGAPIGVLLSQGLLNQTADALGLPSRLSIAPWVAVAAIGGALLVVLVAALLPAWRAGRLSPVTAISRGTGPTTPGRSWLGRQLGRLGLPRPLSLGADDALVRPLRGGLTAVAILLGVATMTFAYGLHGSFNSYHDFAPLQGQVIVERTAPYSDESVIATMRADPATANIVRVTQQNVSIAGLSADVQGTFYDGDSTRLGWLRLSGRWFSGPGEVVVASAFLKTAHRKIGDTVRGRIAGHPVPLKIVGLTFNPDNSGRVVMADWSTLVAAVPDAVASTYYVQLRHGADPAAYAKRIQATQPDFLNATVADFGAASFGILESVMLVLVVVLVLIAIVGVFNTVLLNTRERVRDGAILKTLGMTPGQVALMVAASASVLGLVGGLLGVPAGVALHHGLMGLMGDLLGNQMPAVALNVFQPVILPWLLVAGVAVAILGAAVPARWASQVPVAEVLHAE